MKIWNAGDFVHHDDLNSNFANPASTTSVNGSVSWIETIAGLVGVSGQAASISGSEVGMYGYLGLSRSLGGAGAFGVGGIAINDRTTVQVSAWAGYFEARRLPGAGSIHGLEINPINTGDVQIIDPFTFPVGSAVALHLTAGRPDVSSSADVSAAITIFDNGSKFRHGIVVGSHSILNHALAPGETFQRPVAIDLPCAYGLAWRNGTNGKINAGISSDVTNVSGGGYICFVDTGVSVRDAGNTEVLQVGINGLHLSNAAIFAASVGIQGAIQMTGLLSYANDATAATGGVPLSGAYLNSTTHAVTIRLT